MFPHQTGRRSGFTLMELLVVIIIILLLIGILLPALSAVRGRARVVASRAQLTAISGACETYALTFGEYPGYFAEVDFKDSGFRASFTGTENLVLSLLGRVVPDAAATASFDPANAPATFTPNTIDLDQVGAGPEDSAGRKFGAFYSPKAGELAKVTGTTGANVDPGMFELVDPNTGVPILYYRNLGRAGVPVRASPATLDCSYHRSANEDYLHATALTTADGQSYDQANKSLLSSMGGGGANANNNMAWLVIHPTIGDLNGTPNEATDVVGGGFALISAGRDGIYYNKDDNDGSQNIADRNALTVFDDIVVQGGSN